MRVFIRFHLTKARNNVRNFYKNVEEGNVKDRKKKFGGNEVKDRKAQRMCENEITRDTNEMQ